MQGFISESVHGSDTFTAFYRELYKGCEGKDVEYLQEILQKLGNGIPVSGYFGVQTEEAVLKFQLHNELKPNGRVDQKTFNALKKKADEN